MSTSSRTSPLVFVFGPTGVGKTRFLTEDLPPGFEVVAVDSIQVYRGLDIGSAKPTALELAAVPHHLIDIRDPNQGFDVGDFVTEARAAIQSIASRGRVPVLSGGTAFYFQNLLLGLPETPPSTPETRLEAARFFHTVGEAGLRRALTEVDAVSARRIQSGDAYRLQRAWEVWLLSGRPLSSYGRSGAYPGPVFVAGLDRPRDELYARIEARVDAMIEAGLEDEVRRLVATWGEDAPAFKGIGYAEWLGWLRGEGSLDEVRGAIVLHSRHYAKRQLTFFRSLPGVGWYNADDTARLAEDVVAWSLTNATD